LIAPFTSVAFIVRVLVQNEGLSHKTKPTRSTQTTTSVSDPGAADSEKAQTNQPTNQPTNKQTKQNSGHSTSGSYH